MKTIILKDTSANSERIAVRVSAISIAGNLLLTLLKLLAGILAHSSAMISDAVHSASDVLSSLIVIIGVKISGKKADQSHPYGHERFECVAAMILAFILVLVGGSIGFEALRGIVSGSYLNQRVPGMLAAAAAVISIVGKSLMFLYTRFYARKISSTALKAEAWHHLSDALSSVGALIGIGGAMLGIPVMEPLASIVICLMIFKAAIDIFRDALDQMLDKSAGAGIEKDIRECVLAQPGVIRVDLLQSRMFGNRIYVDIEIGVDRSSSLEAAHAIAESVHDALEQRFPRIKHVMVHVNPV